MREIEFRLDGETLIHQGARRALTAADWTRFAEWVKQYHELCWLPGNQQKLGDLGRQIHDWLDGPERWVERLRDVPAAPVVAEFAVRTRPDENARRFLEVPWELSADRGGHLAAQASVMWAPVRRVGPRAEPLPPNNKNRLGVLFMAASPIGQQALDFDTEELAILRATRHAGLDLVVEDSGNLDELRVAWEDGTFDALHLSCHGLGGPTPFLALEDEGGEPDDVDLGRLATAFAARQPRLLFLSACHTGENDASVDSLALGLVGIGLPAVLAWADAVYDGDASAFAAAFYRQAAHHATSVPLAWALARAELLRPERGHEPPAHWHLARLFLGPHGGGLLATGRAARVASHDAGRKDIVDARGGRIEVASRFEFVGRRREIQAIRREFRHPEHAGVVIHGFGRQGKSSLAARIMDRHPELTRVVLFQRVDGPSILAAIRDRVGESAIDICDRWRDRVDPHRTGSYDPDALYHALRALFDGPCGYAGSGGKPILLVLDDFEALLDPPLGDGHWRVKPAAVASLKAIIRAFAQGGTHSRLLITSRYQFRLGTDSHDPALRLLSVPLAETSLANRLKQARQKLLAMGHAGPFDLPSLSEPAITAARGNAGLQDLLVQAALADPAAGKAAAQALENYLGGGALPAQQELRDTLEQLVIYKLLEPLTDGERILLRVSTGFRLPLPLRVWHKYAAGAGLGRPDRLLAFGLWERLPDIADPHVDAAGPNAIAAARLPSLPGEDAERAIAAILPDLFAAWGGADRRETFFATNIELTRLALAAGNLDVLAATAVFAIRGQEQAFAYRDAAATATMALDALEHGGRAPEIDLLRAAAEIFDDVGDPDGLKRVYANAPDLVSDHPTQPNEIRLARAQLRLRYGGYLQQCGEPDRGLAELQAASVVFAALGDRRSRAVTLGDIARIMNAKGEVEAALALHHERLKTYEALGDRRSRAVTLGDIARIMNATGEVEAALALHQEQRDIFAALGDRRSRAVTLGDIALIMRNKGEIESALALHQEELQTYEALGDRRSRAVTLGDIARIMNATGEVEAALALHQEQRDIFAALGDRRERAVTLGDIARIMTDKGEVEAALALHQEQREIFAALGDRRARAIALGDIARIMTAKGEVEAALALHQEQRDIFAALGDRRSRAVTLGDIARIMTAKGEVEAALALHQERLKTYEALGDRRSRAVTLGDIARIMTAKGEVESALALHQEQRDIFAALGDRRSRAVTLGDIARIMTAKGEVEAALRLQKERADVHRELGDQDGIAAASYDIGQIELSRAVENSDAEAFEAAVAALTESYGIFLKIGRLDGICVVGWTLGQVFAMAGQRDEAREIWQRSLDGFRKLGRAREAAQVEELLRQLGE